VKVHASLNLRKWSASCFDRSCSHVSVFSCQKLSRRHKRWKSISDFNNDNRTRSHPFIYLYIYLFTIYLTTLTATQTIQRRSVGWLANNEQRKCARKYSLHEIRVHIRICQKVMRKTTKHLSQEGRSSDQDVNRGMIPPRPQPLDKLTSLEAVWLLTDLIRHTSRQITWRLSLRMLRYKIVTVQRMKWNIQTYCGANKLPYRGLRSRNKEKNTHIAWYLDLIFL
jgi:hypothetical protein